MHTVAGSDSVGDGGSALAALFSQAEGIAVDSLGAVYVADADDSRVRKITPDGNIQTVAGTGVAGFRGEGGPATAAQLSHPYGLAVDLAGNLYIADLGNARVRKVSLDGTIRTVAGGGVIVPGSASDGSAASAVQLFQPRNLAVAADGTLYISDFGTNYVFQVSPSGALTTLAGNGNAGFSGDGALAKLAQLKAPAGVAVDANGAVYIADSGNNRIRKVYQGVISTIYGIAAPTGIAIGNIGSLYVAASGYFGTPGKAMPGVSPARDVAADRAGNVYVTTGQLVRKVTPAGIVTTIAGSGASRYFGGDNGPATAARLHSPSGVAVDDAGNAYIADTANNRVRKITSAGVITTIAGTGDAGFKGDNGPAALAQLNGPRSVALDSLRNLYVADSGNNAVRKISPAGVITTVAAQLNDPEYVAVGPDQLVYVADSGNNRVVRLTPGGGMSTVTQLLQPVAVAFDRAGNLFAGNSRSITQVTAAGAAAVVLDGLNAPRGLAATEDGALLIAETGANVIRRWSATGSLSILAGTGVAGFSGDEGPAAAAQLNSPADLTVDSTGVIWIADAANHRIRSLTQSAAPASDAIGFTVVHAASGALGPIAPGEIVTIFGTGFQDGQTQLLFDGKTATIFYTGPGQINALAPEALTPGSSTEISILVNGVKIADFFAGVANSVPGIFTMANGTGPVAANNEDGSINSADNPAARGSVVSLYATGEGPAVNAVSLKIGSYSAEVLYAGPAPGFPGLMQINARVPAGFLAPGIQPVVLFIGNTASQAGVTIAVR